VCACTRVRERIMLRLSIVSFKPRELGIISRLGHVSFVLDKLVVGDIFSCCFSFPCHFSVHRHFLVEAGMPIVTGISIRLALTSFYEMKIKNSVMKVSTGPIWHKTDSRCDICECCIEYLASLIARNVFVR
jgi:hypothetical protein